ncbi:MAG: ABC transporter substrate-binding protein [Alphaproteobacteria bacterium]|nr:ABC transporter substrate-binding protein [Alphaproteobacteria bacterium]
MIRKTKAGTGADSMIERRAILQAAPALALLTLTGLPALAAPSPDDARDLIQTVGSRVLEILKQDISQDEKFLKMVELLDGSIDLDLVARLILARHWRRADDAQKTEYLKLFRAYALDSLASKLHIYNGQEFEITDSKPAGKKDAVVRTLITSQDRPPLHVDWRIRERDDGALVAIDVIVESVSLIVTQRSEFGAVVERQGIDGLLDELRRRVDRA